MLQEIQAFLLIVRTASFAYNEISGRLLHHLVEQAGGPDKLGDDECEPAVAIRNTMQFLGKKGAKGFISQDQAELLLKLVPQLQAAVPEPLPTAAEAARRAAAKEAPPKVDTTAKLES